MSAIISRLILPLLLALLALPAHPANKTGVIVKTRDLVFGRFVASSGGTITVTPAGARSKTGGVVLVNGVTATSASYNLTETGTGKSLTWTTIALPSTATLSSGGATMTLSNFVSNPANTVPNGITTLSVGATLTVGPNQAPGNYSGSYSITVIYE
jgi:hypothetical protein